MPNARYHAFAEAPLHTYAPPHPTGRLRRWWVRLATSLNRAAEQAHIETVFQSFAAGAVVGPDFRVSSQAWCNNPAGREHIHIGASVICRGLLSCERFHPGTLLIGNNIYIGDDTLISCAERIEIGDYTMLAHGVQIFDNNSHPLDAAARQRDQLVAVGRLAGERGEIDRAPVWIGERSWIGLNAIILKGVRIGPGSIVAAGSVVTADVPPLTLAAGNPARVIKQLAPPDASTNPNGA